MTELNYVKAKAEPLSRIEFAPDARILTEGGYLAAVYPDTADTVEYVIAEFDVTPPTDSSDVPDGAVVVDISNESITAAIPEAAYGGGSA